MIPSYVHFASVPKTFIDKRRELLFDLNAFEKHGQIVTNYLINEDNDRITFSGDRILIRPTRQP